MYSSLLVNLAIFEKMIDKHRNEIIKHLDKQLESVLQKAQKYLQEYLDGEKLLQNERFSRN